MGRFPLGSKGNTLKSAKKLDTKPLQKPKKINEIAHVVDKNSRTLAKICQLLEIQQKQLVLDNDGNVKDGGNPVFNERIEKLKRRVNRRLIKLAKWSDVPQEERTPLEFRYQKLGTLKAGIPTDTCAHIGHAQSVYRTTSNPVAYQPKVSQQQQQYGTHAYITSQALGMTQNNTPLTSLPTANISSNAASVAWRSLQATQQQLPQQQPPQQQQQVFHRLTPAVGPTATAVQKQQQHTAPPSSTPTPPSWVTPSSSTVLNSTNMTINAGYNPLQPLSNKTVYQQQFQPMYINSNNNNNNYNSRPLFPSLGNYPNNMMMMNNNASNLATAEAMTTSMNMAQTLHNASMALKGIIVPTTSTTSTTIYSTVSAPATMMTNNNNNNVLPSATAAAVTTSRGPLIARPPPPAVTTTANATIQLPTAAPAVSATNSTPVPPTSPPSSSSS